MKGIQDIGEAGQYIIEQIEGELPKIGLILGSGLGVLANELDEAIYIPYEKIPHFPSSTVAGHDGRLVIGLFEGQRVIAMQGRFHYYEGYPMEKVTFPVRVMKQIGVEKLIVTNAAGGINDSFEPGDLMIIRDHINMMGTNPLIGPNLDTFGPRFPDMSEAYDNELILLAEESAESLGLHVQKGVYVGNSGPTYETPSEVKMLRKLGGDAVGMSTVPEVIVARHAGLKVLGISCISNMAAGLLDQPLTHHEVIETTEKVKADFSKLIRTIVKSIR